MSAVTVEMRHALRLLREHGFTYGNPFNDREAMPQGAIACGKTEYNGGIVYVNWQTAYALRRRGLVLIEPREMVDEYDEILLLPARAVASPHDRNT